MNVPVIGVVPLFDFTKNSVWMIPGYIDGLDEAGAAPVILPYTCGERALARAYSACDGILFTGGQDVNPALYKEQKLPVCGECCSVRDFMEKYLLERCLQDDKPAFGICRGLQFFNVALGGTLWQDLPSQRPGSVLHEMKPPYNKPAHAVGFPKDSPLRGLLEKDGARVNSRHHQAIKEVSPRLKISAVSEDGLAEGVYLPGARFLSAVQWHPELDFMVNEDSRLLFSAFVKACAK